MSIPISELKNYLDTNLEFVTDNGTWVLDNLKKGGWTCVGRKAMHCEQLSIGSIKPIVKPLSSLVQELAEWLKDKGFNDFDINDWIGVMKIGGEFRLPFFIAQEIFNRHGDVFDWISKGLAINKEG